MLSEASEPLTSNSVSSFLFNTIPPSPCLQLTVIVPVRNEAEHLIATLNALRNQRDASGSPLDPARYEVLLLANNCTDHSYAVAAHYQLQYPNFPLHIAQIQLPTPQANIGTVRRLLMDEAYRRLMSVGNNRGIIASTDGDTVVDTQWIWHTIQEIEKGNDAVGGRIITRTDNNPARLYHLRDVMYRSLMAQVEAVVDPNPHDPWPRHFQHFGASIAVTCSMYHRAGRLPRVPYLEDEAFHRALLRVDARIRKSPHVKVLTSTRLRGRVDVGFSEQLRQWTDMHGTNRMQLVESGEAIIGRFINRKRLRACWAARHQSDVQQELSLLAGDLLIEQQWLKHTFGTSRFFGQLWENVEERMMNGRWKQQWEPVTINRAIQTLRHFLRTQVDD